MATESKSGAVKRGVEHVVYDEALTAFKSFFFDKRDKWTDEMAGMYFRIRFEELYSDTWVYLELIMDDPKQGFTSPDQECFNFICWEAAVVAQGCLAKRDDVDLTKLENYDTLCKRVNRIVLACVTDDEVDFAKAKKMLEARKFIGDQFFKTKAARILQKYGNPEQLKKFASWLGSTVEAILEDGINPTIQEAHDAIKSITFGTDGLKRRIALNKAYNLLMDEKADLKANGQWGWPWNKTTQRIAWELKMDQWKRNNKRRGS